MANILFSNPWNGHVHLFNGSSWSIFTTSVAPSWSSAAAARYAALVEWKGQLWTIYQPYTTTELFVATISSLGVYTFVAQPNTVSAPRASNFLCYRDALVSLVATAAAGGVSVMCFTGASPFASTVYDAGMPHDRYASDYAFNDTRQAGRMVPFRHSIIHGPWGSKASDDIDSNRTGTYGHWNVVSRIDPRPSGAISVNRLAGGPDGASATLFQDSSTSAKTLTMIRECAVGFGTYQNKLYIIAMDGGVREMDPSTGAITVTPWFNMQTPAAMSSTDILTGNSRVDGINVNTSSTNFISKIWPYGLTFTTSDGRNGVAHGLGSTSASIANLIAIDTATGSLLASVTTGTMLTNVKLGLLPRGFPTPDYEGGACVVLGFEHLGAFWVVLCGSKSRTAGLAEMPFIIARKTATAENFYSITSTLGGPPNASSMSMTIDPDTNYFHFIYAACPSSPTVVRHIIWDPVTRAVIGEYSVGSFTTYSTGYGQPLSLDSVLAYSFTDPTAEVDSVTFDASGNKTTILYTLCQATSLATSVTIQHFTTAGWETCTRKGVEGEGIVSLTTSPTGVQHTFVHDLSTGTSLIGSATQYRVIPILS